MYDIGRIVYTAVTYVNVRYVRYRPLAYDTAVYGCYIYPFFLPPLNTYPPPLVGRGVVPYGRIPCVYGRTRKSLRTLTYDTAYNTLYSRANV